MFEVDPGSRAEWQAHGASSLEPRLGLPFEANDQPLSSNAQASKRSFRRASVWVLLAIAITSAAFWTRFNLEPVPGQSGLRANLDGVARLTGFGIDMVVLTGHQFTSDSDIFDALDLPNARSLMSFDTEGVRRRLERLPWVLSADLTRVFPDRLDVRVRERKAFAVWVHDGQSLLIDDSGRQLSAVNRSEGLGLARVSGEGAPEDAQRFLSILTQVPDIYQKLDFAERVGERRWSVHLTNGVIVHLPPDRESAALATVARGGRLARLLEPGNRVIDLRSPGRIAVRASAARTRPEGQAAVPAIAPSGLDQLALAALVGRSD